ncbi:Fatty acid metabolism regulator protein [Corynebacterium freiburgense]|nr:Fatty acid metabolism regulator protein [Corynebacterium freiburgense]
MGNDAILRAVVRLIATRGPEQTSVRNVASEAGVSIGAVQHHYRTKDDLLLAAMRGLNAEFITRMQEILAEIPDAKQRLRAFIHAISAVDSEARDGAIIWTVFAARSCVHQGLRTEHSENWAHVEEYIFALMVEAFPGCGIVRDDAAYLLALADGIAVARAAENNERMTEQRAASILDTALKQFEQRKQS